jgi:hypothetical protein
MDKEIFLVEELENRLAIEAVQYMHKVEELWETNKFEPTYFDTYITGPLYGEFIQAIYDRIKPLNSHEANRFLTLSVAQFKTHTPERREKDFILNYWHTKWFPNAMGDDVSEHDEKYAKHVWRHYTNHFHLYKDAAEKGLEDFKAGLLGSQPAQVKTNGTMTEPIKYEAFNHYLNQFKYNYPYRTAVFDFKFSMRDYLDYFKTEILDNIIILSKDDRKAYLNKLKYELENKKQHAYTTQETIDEWLAKYNVESEEAIRAGKKDNELYTILTSEPPEFEDEFAENFNRDTHGIQTDFYNYYYGFYLDTAITFIVEQINELNPLQSLSSNGSQAHQILSTATPKLKTDLSVPQLALLFKMLNDLKPNIFEVKSEAELHRFISANFETKKSKEDGISTDKLRILFNQPDSKAANFWEKHFYTLIAEIKKFK